MPRRIVLVRSHDPLQEGWRQRAFGPAGLLLEERVKVSGVRFDETYHPVQVWRRSGRGDAAIGATADVARGLGVPALRRAGLTGGGVHVAIVDTGIDGSRIPVVGGWAPTPGYVPGSSAPNHGTMVAYDVRIAAPDAQILDY